MKVSKNVRISSTVAGMTRFLFLCLIWLYFLFIFENVPGFVMTRAGMQEFLPEFAVPGFELCCSAALRVPQGE